MQYIFYFQVDQQVIAYLETLQNELRQICKANPTTTHLLQLKIGEEDDSSLNTEVIYKSLSELLKQFGLSVGANVLKKTV